MADTFTWFGGSGFGNAGTNWTPAGPPGSGDIAIVDSGTVMLVDSKLNDNLLELNAGTFQLSNTIGNFFTVGNEIVSGFDSQTTLIAGTLGAAELDLFGDFVNVGTIEVIGHTLTLAVEKFTGTSAYVGTLANEGIIDVLNGATLDVTGTSAATFQGGDVVVNSGDALVANVDDVASNFTLGNSATLGLDSPTTDASVQFSGTADTLKLYSTALDSTIDVGGFTHGDTLDIGDHEIGTIIYEGQQMGSGSGMPILTILSNTGGTLLSDPFSDPNGNFVGNTSGTFTVGTLAGGVVGVGPFEITTAGNGDTLLQELPPSTWSWIGPVSASGSAINSSNNWEPVGGPGNAQGSPNAGDTVVIHSSTLDFGLDNAQLQGNTIYLTGTTQLGLVGDFNSGTNSQSGSSIDHPTIDQATLITNDPVTAASTTVMNFGGYMVNEGTIVSDGAPGSTFLVNITAYTTGEFVPGYLINDGVFEADAGNSMTIDVIGTSELFNVSLLVANGGSLLVTAGTAAVAGGYAPALGMGLIENGGTFEINTGYPTGTSGTSPMFAFAGTVAGNTLKIDQLSQFSGRILGFEQGDTIDLGSALSIGTITVKSDGRVLLESSTGTVLDTLVLTSGAYTPGTYATTLVAAGTDVAGGFTLTTGADGNTLLTTSVVDTVTTNQSGTWQETSSWVGGIVPGPSATAVIGFNPSNVLAPLTPFVLTTGSLPVTVNSLTEVSADATLQITSATTVGTGNSPYLIGQVAGDIEVTGGNALTASGIRQLAGSTSLQVDAGAVLDLTGHLNLGFVNDGTISLDTVVNGTTLANGNTVGMLLGGTVTVEGLIDAGPVMNGTNVVSTGGFIDLGADSGGAPATMTVQNGGSVIDTYANLTSDPTSFGVLALTGPGTVWDDAGDPDDLLNQRGAMIVGANNQVNDTPAGVPLPPDAGTAQLLVENGATLLEASHAEIGSTADSAGSVTITSGGIWTIGTGTAGGFMNVGDGGSGTLTINDDGIVNILSGNGTYINNGTVGVGQGMGVAHDPGSDGTIFISGGGQLNIFGTGGVGIGQNGQGILDVYSQGTFTENGNGISAGSTLGGSGTIIVGGSNPDGGPSTGGALFSITGGGLTIGRGATLTSATTLTAYGSLLVNDGGTVLLSGGGFTVGSSLGASGFATIESGGTVSENGAGITVGSQLGATGFLEVNGGLLTESSGTGLGVGYDGVGTVEVLDSGTVSLSGGGVGVGVSAGSNGLLEIASGGMVTSTTNGLEVGQGGTGTLEVLAGGIYNVSTHGIGIGVSAGSFGTVLVEGVGAQINLGVSGTDTGSGTAFGVGELGTGYLTVQNNGSVLLGNNSLDIGENSGDQGTVSVSSGGDITVKDTGGINVGQVGNGLLTIAAGGTVSAANFIGIAPGSSGTVIVNGGTLDDGGFFSIGGTGQGTLVVEGGGTVDQTGVNFDVGQNSGSHGTVVVDGGTLVTGGELSIASLSANVTGTLLVEAGGLVSSITTGGTVADISATGTGTAAATVSDGTWKLSGGELVIGDTGQGSLTVTSSGSVIVGTNPVSIGNQAAGVGTVTVENDSTLSAGSFTVGDSGYGLLNVAGGSVVDQTGSTGFTIGENAGANGAVTVDGVFNAGSAPVTLGNASNSSGDLTVTGVGAGFTALNRVNVGLDGTGNLLVANHASVVVGSLAQAVGLDIGGASGASGLVAVSADAQLQDTGQLIVGDDAIGNLSIQSGATVATAVGSAPEGLGAIIANQAGASGSSVTVSGDGSDWKVTGNLLVGNAGAASLNITGGGTVSATTLNVGVAGGGDGIVSISGDSSSLITSGTLGVGTGGASGAGELSILSGANVNIGGDFDIGTSSGASGNVDIEDTTGTVFVGGNLNLGVNGGVAVLTVGYGSTLEVDNGGVNGGPNAVLIPFSPIDPFYSNGVTYPISSTQVQSFPAYVADSRFNLSQGVTYTLETPAIYAGSGFEIGAGTSDTEPTELVLNAGSFSANSSVTFESAVGTLVVGVNALATIEMPISGTSSFTKVVNPDAGVPLIGSFDGTLKQFQAGDVIIVDTSVAATFSQSGSIVSVIANGTTLGVLTFDTVGAATAATSSGLENEVVAAPCFAAGTRIATARGEVAVEDLAVGDRVPVVLGEDEAEIIWIGQRSVNCARHPNPASVWPVRIAAGAFGVGQPHAELWLSPDHAVYVNDVLIPVRHLINGTTIVQVKVDTVTYYHLELPRHDVLLAEGLAVESYLDMKDGSNYANRPGPVRLYPDFSTRMWDAFGCAKLVVSGVELAEVRALIKKFARNPSIAA